MPTTGKAQAKQTWSDIHYGNTDPRLGMLIAAVAIVAITAFTLLVIFGRAHYVAGHLQPTAPIHKHHETKKQPLHQ